MTPSPMQEPLHQEESKLVNKMVSALTVWDESWGSDGPESGALAAVCSPGMRVLDGYVSVLVMEGASRWRVGGCLERGAACAGLELNVCL